MKWNWDPDHWKGSTKVLLGMATIWPVIYIALFILTIFSLVFLTTLAQDRSSPTSKNIDLIQLDRKIKNGELKQLTVRQSEIVALDRIGSREYRTEVTNESTRAEILKAARELDANGRPLVAKVEEQTDQPVSPLFPVGIVALFGAHMLTILLIMGLMPLYIILAVKSDRHDQTMRIIWVVLICMMGMLAMPVYWYLYVWREPSVKLAGESATQPPADNTSGTA